MGSAAYSDDVYGYSRNRKHKIKSQPKVKQTISDYMPSADMVEEIIKLQKELKAEQQKET